MCFVVDLDSVVGHGEGTVLKFQFGWTCFLGCLLETTTKREGDVIACSVLWVLVPFHDFRVSDFNFSCLFKGPTR